MIGIANALKVGEKNNKTKGYQAFVMIFRKKSVSLNCHPHHYRCNPAGWELSRGSMERESQYRSREEADEIKKR